MKHDIVAQYPKDISDYYRMHGSFPDNFKMQDGFVCALEGERYFIHTRAMLPLKAVENGIGFGLWVEVSRDEFMRYIEAASSEDNEVYKSFQTEGTLANEWPGFEGMKGARVKVKTFLVNDKVYISEVLDVNDPLFMTAVLTPTDDQGKIDRLFDLVKAYVEDPSMNQAF